MAAQASTSLLNLAIHDGNVDATGPPFGRLLILSLALHGGILLLAVGLDMRQGSTPLVAQEVALVSLPSPSAGPSRKRAKPKQAITPKPKQQPMKVAPPNQVAKASPVPPEPTPAITPKPKQQHIKVIPPNQVAKASPVPPEPTPEARSEALMREALGKIKLPASQIPSTMSMKAVHTPEASPASVEPRREVAPAPRVASQEQPKTDATMREALDKIVLPPKTPAFKDVASVPTVQPTPALPARKKTAPPVDAPKVSPERAPARQLEKDVRSLVQKLEVPAVPAQAKKVEPPAREVPPVREQGPSLSEGVRRKLDRMERLQVAKARPVEPPPRVPPAREADRKRPKVVPETVERPSSAEELKVRIQAPGATAGSSEYLARIQNKISRHWIAPPVDLSGSKLVVVIRFRLHRSGAVSELAVEESSGNEYYDLAAERAVMSADPLPSFPHHMRDHYLDTHFTFAVGEQVG